MCNLSVTKPEARYYFTIFFILQFFGWTTFFHQALSKTFKISALLDYSPFEVLPFCRLNVSTLGFLDTEGIIQRLEQADSKDRQALTTKLIEGGLKSGGYSSPINCRATEKIAIIIPFRQREDHLDVFLRYMHPYLQRKFTEYKIFVIEQTNGLPFNRGSLLNVGFVEALKSDSSFDCFIFHDVDMLPEHERNDYSCPKEGEPRQIAYIVDIWDYKPVQKHYAGGVTAINTKDFWRTNGFSNKFWGWGSEDDDFSRRLRLRNMTLTRATDKDPAMAQYVGFRTLYHKSPKISNERAEIFHKTETIENIATDGINSLRYEKKHIQPNPYYTHIQVELFRDVEM